MMVVDGLALVSVCVYVHISVFTMQVEVVCFCVGNMLSRSFFSNYHPLSVCTVS